MSTAVRPRYDWYQDDRTVSIVLYETAVAPESFSVDWSNDLLRIVYRTPYRRIDSRSESECGSHTLELRLYSQIVFPDDYKCSISEKKVEMRFRKASQGHWHSLEATPSSGPSSLTTFSKIIEMRIEQQLAEPAEPSEDEKFIRMLQEIYERSDDATKRAMNKSFSSSNGSMLSTDWNDVRQQKY